jgi:hypothetical protein
MCEFDDAIEKLLRRIQRAANKNKWGKVQRLTQQLNQLQDLAEQHDEQESLGEEDSREVEGVINHEVQEEDRE